MNSSTLRRLASDQVSLRHNTPPNYLFTEDSTCFPDDLTQLVILLTGAQGTPYSQGLWRLHLKMPDDYPKNPPKATFKTRIFHPNIEESTGLVCLDTLKRDWQSKLTLRDILVTISCLLIHPNPDSALNSTAGALLQENYEAFARQAKLMTQIHAPISRSLREAVLTARRRGEEGGTVQEDETEERPVVARASSSSTSVVMKKQTESRPALPAARATDVSEETRELDDQDDSKENEPSERQLKDSTLVPMPSKRAFGKRPLSDLPVALDSSDQSNTRDTSGREPMKKSPKLMRPPQKPPTILKDAPCTDTAEIVDIDPNEDQENIQIAEDVKPLEVTKTNTHSQDLSTTVARPTLRKVSNLSSSRGKTQPRVGIRRL